MDTGGSSIVHIDLLHSIVVKIRDIYLECAQHIEGAWEQVVSQHDFDEAAFLLRTWVCGFRKKIKDLLMDSTGTLMLSNDTADPSSYALGISCSGQLGPSPQGHSHGSNNSGSAKTSAGFGALLYPLGSPMSEYNNMLIKYLVKLHSGSLPHSLITSLLHN